MWSGKHRFAINMPLFSPLTVKKAELKIALQRAFVSLSLSTKYFIENAMLTVR